MYIFTWIGRLPAPFHTAVEYCAVFPRQLLNCVLSETGAGSDGRSVLVRLHGLLQTDDNSAIRHITTQLKLESAVGDRVFGSFAGEFARTTVPAILLRIAPVSLL